MNPDTQPAQLNYFLQEDIYLLKTDKDLYRNANQTAVTPLPVEPAPATPPEQPAVAQTPAITFKYLGGNQKNFLVLAHYPAGEFLADAHLTALTSTLARINFTLNDVAIVNLAHQQEKSWQAISRFFEPKKLLVLGVNAAPHLLPRLNAHQLQQTDGIAALLTFSFDEMMSNNENKKTFWNQIKNI